MLILSEVWDPHTDTKFRRDGGVYISITPQPHTPQKYSEAPAYLRGGGGVVGLNSGRAVKDIGRYVALLI